MPTSYRLALAQINTTVGDFEGNIRKIHGAVIQARRAGVHLVAFPELSVTGYPPEDLLFKRAFVDANLNALKRLAKSVRGVTAVVGFVDRDAQGRLYNAAAVLSGGEWRGSYRKIELPNYGVFDEKRYFQCGDRGLMLEAGAIRTGLSICEDIWLPQSFAYQEPYRGQSSLILNISASPYHVGKLKQRHALVRSLARHTGAHVAYLNLVGGQDELVFDGGSFVMSPHGMVLAQAHYLKEDLLIADLALQTFKERLYGQGAHTLAVDAPKRRPGRKKAAIPKEMGEEEELYRALELGTRDYVEKNGFQKVLIGLSGGIDSAIVARIAVDALGASRVIGVTMPSRFSSKGTYRDALELGRRLKIRTLEIPIEPLFSCYLETLKKAFGGAKPDSAEENLQARIRGNLLMALSNKFGHLVLTTGNKSEMATGYCTLYGDMAGGFAVIKDVPKTWVYRIARWRNRVGGRPSIPESVLRRAPSAELKQDQTDQDTLPPYEELDAILKSYVEEDRSIEDLAKAGFAKKTLKKVGQMLGRNEYKRRQTPPGIKITPKAFGRDRRMPITNKFGL